MEESARVGEDDRNSPLQSNGLGARVRQVTMAESQKTKKFGIDPSTHELILGSWRLQLPQSRAWRIALGAVLIFGGILGFLPFLGFWMIPLGLIVLSHDLAFVRRQRRRLSVWWARKRETTNTNAR